jgi:hypothetical protein
MALMPRERERAIDRLTDAFANDELDMDEFERRVALAHRVLTPEEMNALLADLRPPQTPARAADVKGATAPATLPRRAPRTLDADDVRGWGFAMGVMGGTSKRGHWIAARHTATVAIMGGVELDFREAVLPPGVTDVYAVAFWGGVEIIVPPGLPVEVSGVGIMGGFDHNHTSPVDPGIEGPILRISGVAVMGGVEVTVRLPGETARDAKLRVKEEKRTRKLGRAKDKLDRKLGRAEDDDIDLDNL